MYNRRLRSRLLNPNRLERTKDILKATAVIGRTLIEAIDSAPKPDQAGRPAEDDSIEGSFRVVQPEAEPGPTATPEQKLLPVEVIIIGPSGADPAKASPDREPAQPTGDASRPKPKQNTEPKPDRRPAAEGQPGRSSAKQSTDSDRESQLPPLFSDIPLPLGDLPPRLRQWIDKIPLPQSSQTEQTKQDDERFLSRSFTNEAGTRAYKLYVPSSYQGQAWPLVVMLHGCTQSPDDFATSTYMNEFAEKHSFLVLYPAQTFKANLGKCWNWFKESEQQRDQGEPAIIAGMTREVIKSYQIDPRRVYVTGISAGGAMAMVLGATYPDLFAAVGIQSGVPYGVAQNIPTGLAAIKGMSSASADRLSSAPGGQAKLRSVPTIVFHGDQDSLVHPGNGDQIIAQWLEVGAKQNGAVPKPRVKLEQGQVPGGHAYTRSIYQDEQGVTLMEQWLVHGAGHAWSGGNPNVAWTDAKGPSATQEMLRFFYEHPHPEA
ncbi:MAG TPA: PHB depolymerase family esterase [Anaerolineae bacterium]|nr:PHB depolymerase family esterase [Anaerolineae bacterium]